ncbi:M48 family metalloprotease [Streptomyces racemochromogenes]|uniref:M48 family metalloprotease n=1 Tax=Streptomyces racemochromogenes TaxID=67353 RepID=UPI0031ED18C3
MSKDAEPLDDLEYRHAPGTRVHYWARHRVTDLAAVARLVLHLPGILFSLVLVLLLARGLQYVTGVPYGIPTGLWLAAAGVLAFHRPTEALLARYLLRLGHPVPQEAALLGPVWREVTARAGVDGTRYQLWVEESDELNASAAGGHLVIVTRHSLETLPTSQLAAVLAHELGHHAGGHAWTRMLSWWYALPGRLVWKALVGLVRMVPRGRRRTAPTTLLVPAALVGWLTYRTVPHSLGLGLLLLALAALVTVPLLIAAAGRRAELRADRHAAALGFGPPLAEVLMSEPQEDERGLLRLLLSSHPPPRTRLHHLQRHLELQG